MENLKIDLPDFPEPDYKRMVDILGLPEKCFNVTSVDYMQATDVILTYLNGCKTLPRIKRKIITSCIVSAVAQDWTSLDILEEVVKEFRELKLQDITEDNFEEFLENLKK